MTPQPRVPASPLRALVESLDELDAALKLAASAVERARLFASQLDDDAGVPTPRPMWAPQGARSVAPLSPSWPVDASGPLTFGSADEPDNLDDFPPETLAAYRGTRPDGDPGGG